MASTRQQDCDQIPASRVGSRKPSSPARDKPVSSTATSSWISAIPASGPESIQRRSLLSLDRTAKRAQAGLEVLQALPAFIELERKDGQLPAKLNKRARRLPPANLMTRNLLNRISDQTLKVV